MLFDQRLDRKKCTGFRAAKKYLEGEGEIPGVIPSVLTTGFVLA